MKLENQLAELLQSKEGKEKLTELAVLYALLQKYKDSQQPNLDVTNQVEKLKTLASSLSEKYTFKEGDLVVWKEGHINRSVPLAGEPAIVLKVLDEPIIDNRVDFASTYFQEKYDLVLGVLRENTLVSFHYPSERFQPFNQ